MVITTHNSADRPITAPMRFALPFSPDNPEQWQIDGQHVAHRLWDVGVHSTIYEADVWYPQDALDLELTPLPPNAVDRRPFVPHPAVFDGSPESLKEILPVSVLNGVQLLYEPPKLVSQSRRHQLWSMVEESGSGVQVHWYYLIRSRCPWIEVTAAIGYTALDRPQFAANVSDRWQVSFGEEFWTAYAAPLGLDWEPGREWFAWTPPNGVLDFGVQFVVRGLLLCRGGRATGDVDAAGRSLDELDEQALQDAKHEPAWGVWDGWGEDGRPWLLYGVKPTKTVGFDMEAALEENRWIRWKRTAGNGYQSRPYTGKFDPSGPGDDLWYYGLTSGTIALYGEPWWLNAALVGGADDEAQRPCHAFEADGEPIAAKQHPGMITWTRQPHPQLGSDWLGKPRGAWWPRASTGRTCDDDAHWSDSVTWAAYALTGDPMTGLLMRCRAAMDLSSAAIRTGRAGEGREDRRIRGLQTEAMLLGDIGEDWPAAIGKVVDISHDAAVRATNTCRQVFLDPRALPVMAVSTFHQCLSAQSLFSIPANEKADRLAYDLAASLLRCAIRDDGKVRGLAYYWAWNGGEGPTTRGEGTEWNEARDWLWQYLHCICQIVRSFHVRYGGSEGDALWALMQRVEDRIGPPQSIDDAEWQASKPRGS